MILFGTTSKKKFVTFYQKIEFIQRHEWLYQMKSQNHQLNLWIGTKKRPKCISLQSNANETLKSLWFKIKVVKIIIFWKERKHIFDVLLNLVQWAQHKSKCKRAPFEGRKRFYKQVFSSHSIYELELIPWQ